MELLPFLFSSLLPFGFFPTPHTIQPATSPVVDVEFLGCGAQIMTDRLYRQQPAMLEHALLMEKRLYEALRNPSLEFRAPVDYTLPVVIHVIHNGGAENVDDSQILKGLQHLNDAFGLKNYYQTKDQGTGAETHLNFCLARQDPQGRSTTGINRLTSPLTEMRMEEDDLALKNLIRWDPKKYINIWLVKEICRNSSGCSVAGYAYLPGAHGSVVDGIVMEARWFGSSEAASSVQAHEMGHYLGLYHTFDGGCANEDCLRDGDKVCDTPPDQSTAAVSCTDQVNTCQSDTLSGFVTDQNDQYWNFMDYGHFGCYASFTQGQTDRMRFIVENGRSSLLESTACLDPCAVMVDVEITPAYDSLEVGRTVTFTAKGTNVTQFSWRLNSKLQNNLNTWNHTFLQEGLYSILLKAGNSNPSCVAYDTLQVKIVCPVIASFMVDTTAVIAGDTIHFSNTSQKATLVKWIINGDTVSNALTLDYVFKNPGIFEVKLLAGNGFCSRQSESRIVIVADPKDCEPQLMQVEFPEFSRVTLVKPIPGKGFIGIGNTGAGAKSSLFRLDLSGKVVWAKTIGIQADHTLQDIYLDPADAGIFLVGTLPGPAGLVKGFTLKMTETADPVWTQLIDLPVGTGKGHIVATPDNNILVAYSAGGFGTHFSKLDKTGNLLWQRSLEKFEVLRIINNQEAGFWAIGRPGGNYGSSQVNKELLKLDSNGAVLWVKGLGSAGNNMAGVPDHCPLQINDSGGVFTSLVVHPPAGVAGAQVFLLSTDSNGNILWIKTIFNSNALILAAPQGVVDIQRTADGHYLSLVQLVDSTAILLNKFDAKGQFLLQYGYKNILGNDLEIRGNAPSTISGSRDGKGYLLLADQNGLAGYCNIFFPRLTARDFQISSLNGVLNEIGPFSWQPVDPVVEADRLVALPICYDSYYPEARVTLTEALNCNGLLSVAFNVCNTGNLEFPAETAIGVYRKRPLHPNDGKLATFYSSAPLAADSCKAFFYTLEGAETDSLFIVFNNNSYFATDQEPNGGQGSFIFECNFSNNIDSIPITQVIPQQIKVDIGADTILCVGQSLLLNASDRFSQYRWQDHSTDSTFWVTKAGLYFVDLLDACGNTHHDSVRVLFHGNPTLNLGPDQYMCDNGIFTLHAGSGFASYLWQDGSTDSIFTAWQQGNYWVEVTDACNIKTADTIRIDIADATVVDIGNDTTLCAGQNISLKASGFDHYRWYADSTLLCDTCTALDVRLAGTDTLEVQQYSVRALTQDGCMSLDTVLVTILPALTGRDTLSICRGDTLLLEGIPVFDDMEWVRNLISVNGCDSVHTSTIIAMETSRSIDSLSICKGDSVNIFGQLVSSPGFYSDTIVRTMGCDSIYTVSLKVWDNPFILWPDSIVTLPAGEAVGLSPQVSGSGTFQFDWQPASGLSCTHCAMPIARPDSTTIYTLRVTDANGCKNSAQLTLKVDALPDGVFIPNAFSPNGDTFNDRFYVYAGPTTQLVQLFRVFDRWGNLVFEKKDFPAGEEQYGWDGTFNGRPLTPAVYGYYATLIRPDGTTQFLVGEVTLMR